MLVLTPLTWPFLRSVSTTRLGDRGGLPAWAPRRRGSRPLRHGAEGLAHLPGPTMVKLFVLLAPVSYPAHCMGPNVMVYLMRSSSACEDHVPPVSSHDVKGALWRRLSSSTMPTLLGMPMLRRFADWQRNAGMLQRFYLGWPRSLSDTNRGKHYLL